MDFSGMTVAVTGAGRGIGREVALRFAQSGANVLMIDKGTGVATSRQGDAAIVESAAEELRRTSSDVLYSDADVSDADSVECAMDLAIERWGTIDIVVNAAGIIRDRMIWNVSDDEWNDVQAVHLRGCLNTMRHFARHIRTVANPERGFAAVNFGSSAGVFGNPGSTNYGAAKAGVIQLSRIAAMELGRLNTRVNCVVPFAHTRMAAELPGEDEEARLRLERLQRLTPVSIADLTVCLARIDSAWMTGQVIGMRGKELLVFAPPSIDQRILAAATDPDSLGDLIDSRIAAMVTPPQPSTEIFDYEPWV